MRVAGSTSEQKGVQAVKQKIALLDLDGMLVNPREPDMLATKIVDYLQQGGFTGFYIVTHRDITHIFRDVPKANSSLNKAHAGEFDGLGLMSQAELKHLEEAVANADGFIPPDQLERISAILTPAHENCGKEEDSPAQTLRFKKLSAMLDALGCIEARAEQWESTSLDPLEYRSMLEKENNDITYILHMLSAVKVKPPEENTPTMALTGQAAENLAKRTGIPCLGISTAGDKERVGEHYSAVMKDVEAFVISEWKEKEEKVYQELGKSDQQNKLFERIKVTFPEYDQWKRDLPAMDDASKNQQLQLVAKDISRKRADEWGGAPVSLHFFDDRLNILASAEKVDFLEQGVSLEMLHFTTNHFSKAAIREKGIIQGGVIPHWKRKAFLSTLNRLLQQKTFDKAGISRWSVCTLFIHKFRKKPGNIGLLEKLMRGASDDLSMKDTAERYNVVQDRLEKAVKKTFLKPNLFRSWSGGNQGDFYQRQLDAIYAIEGDAKASAPK